MSTRIDRKIRLYVMLPYGYASKQALSLATKIPDIAYLEYSPEISMEDRVRVYDQGNTATTRRIERMMATGYLEEIVRKFGSSRGEQVRLIRLTRSGFYLLTSTPDKQLEFERTQAFGMVTDRKIKEMTYRSDTDSAGILRELIYKSQLNGPSDDPEQADVYEAFLEAVNTGEMTVLACDSALAENVIVNSQRYNSARVYRSWRLANINALFMANGFLTYLDRRPLDTGWAISGITDEVSYLKYLASGEMDITPFMYHALNKWYSDHPDSYRFSDPLSGLESFEDFSQAEGGDGLRSWRSTPAFYAASEIAGFTVQDDEYDKLTVTGGQKNYLRHTFSGVAVGPKTSYIIHHTRPKKTPWSERIEMSTIEVAQRALRDAKQAISGSDSTQINNAIMICASVYQFYSLFENARSKMPKKWRKEKRVGVPYDSVCIVPINGSGAMQLRGLMLTSPSEFEMHLINTLIKRNSNFKRTNESLFQLSYNDVPVLLAHSMDFQRLFLAVEEYLEGTKFYVSCYPGQVKYIQKIMPDVLFL